MTIYVDLNKDFNQIDINTEEYFNKTKDTLNNKWKLDVSQKPKLKTYIKFKDTLITE